jgi:hypothetical protein
VARAEDGGAPIPFALVRLVPADSATSPSGAPPQGITSADGRYRFGGVAAGRYRVQLLRIGFRPVLSDPVQVTAGETARLPLTVASQPLALPPVTVTAEGCVTAGALAGHPQLQTLWQQARDGASIREGLMARFRYRSVLREKGVELRPEGPVPMGVMDRPLVSDPRWALRNAARNRAHRLSRGYYSPNDERRVGAAERAGRAARGVPGRALPRPGRRARRRRGGAALPVRARRDFLDVRGVIWLDSATYLARRIELEYVDGEESRGAVRLDFGDVAVAGGTLRMPVGGVYAMRPSRRNPAKRTEGKFTFTYSGFEEVPPR